MLRWRTIPIQASLSEVNPRLSSLIGDGITVSRRTQEWKSFSALPRRALLNNFGAAGSNVALLLEEYVDLRLREDVGCSRTAYPFNVSARSPWALRELVQQYQRFLKVKDPQIDIRDICYTATARRQIYEHRSSFTCTSAEDLSEQLETANLDISKDDKLSKSIVFVFSGQGSSYLGMGKELMETSTLFKNIVKTCDEVIQNLGFPSVIQLLQSKDNNSISMEENDQVVAFQCACVIVEYALARLWMSWNVLPDIVLGHR